MHNQGVMGSGGECDGGDSWNSSFEDWRMESKNIDIPHSLNPPKQSRRREND